MKKKPYTKWEQDKDPIQEIIDDAIEQEKLDGKICSIYKPKKEILRNV